MLLMYLFAETCGFGLMVIRNIIKDQTAWMGLIEDNDRVEKFSVAVYR
jgi:hypothetical protein